jgi:hypothetical protein
VDLRGDVARRRIPESLVELFARDDRPFGRHLRVPRDRAWQLAQDEVSAKIAATGATEAVSNDMKNSNEPDGGPVPKWMRLLVERWRIAD